MKIPFQQVDVFTDVPFMGNPVAVVLDGNNLTSKAMQEIANWTNLSETTFVCSPTDSQADYQLRIFTPHSELPFAGHPTIGSACAVLKHGISPKIPGRLVQECKRGLVSITTDNDKLFLTMPDSMVHNIPPVTIEELASVLGIPSSSVKVSAVIDVGPLWMTLQLSSADEVRSLHPDMGRLASLTPEGVTGLTVFGFWPTGADSHIEVRSFAPGEGIAEDPVCGSGNGCVATLIRQHNLIEGTNYVASQGYCIGRNGRVEVRFQDNDQIWLGGHAVTCVEGTISV